LKCEKRYLNPTEDGIKLYQLLTEYFNYYNLKRRHESIDYETPESIYKKPPIWRLFVD